MKNNSISFILASGNLHKAEEFAKLLDKKIIKIEAAPEALDVDETGSKFSENALLKAEAYYKKYKTPVLSDDSGICVDALPDQLGIFSARFGGDNLSDKERAELLLEKMKNIESESRTAHFSCVLCAYLSPDEIYFFEGRVDGSIGYIYKGDYGFGYDPIFHPNGDHSDKTLAMLPEWKEKNSHRARASKVFLNFFSERVCQI